MKYRNTRPMMMRKGKETRTNKEGGDEEK